MTAFLLLAAAVAFVAAAVGWLWHVVPFTRRGVARRLARPEFWEQVLAGRDHAELTAFGPVAHDAMEAARRLGYEVSGPTPTAARTTFTIRRP